MVPRKVRVAVNGYGVIGKRVAGAVALQDDMESIGVADVVSDYRIRVATQKGIPVFAADAAKQAEMKASGVAVQGALPDLLAQIDIIAD